MGRTSFSVTTAWPMAVSIQARMMATWTSFNLSPAGGMAFETTLSTSRLLSEAPGCIAGPERPPRRIESSDRRSSPACGFSAPWHDQQLALKIGTTSDSKRGDWPKLADEAATQKARLMRHAFRKLWGGPTGPRPAPWPASAHLEVPDSSSG